MYLPKLGIRKKILISISIILFSLFLIESILFQHVFLNGFKQAEQENMISDIQRIEGLIQDQISNYVNKSGDWSSWDDSYDFMVTKNPTYIKVNLMPPTFQSLKLNFMVYIASNGAIFYEAGADHVTGKVMNLPKDFNDLLIKDTPISRHKTIDSISNGVIRLSSGFVIFASRPILTSGGEGPIRGTLVFARFIDKEFLNYISSLERSNVEIESYYSNALPKDFIEAKEQMQTKGIAHKEPNGDLDYYYIKEISGSSIAGYTIINDYFGKPAYIIKNTLDRPFFSLGTSITNFSLIVLGVVSLVFLLFALEMLNILVINKIRTLDKEVEQIKDKINPRRKLEIKGDDEFANLAQNINNMLDEIAKSEEDVNKQSELLKQRVQELEAFKDLTVGRELKMIELKKKIAELEGSKND